MLDSAALPVRVERVEPALVELQVDARAVPNGELANAKVEELELTAGALHFKLPQLKIASFETGPIWRIRVELPAPVPEDPPIVASLKVKVGVVDKFRAERFAAGAPAPQLPGFKLVATRPNQVSFEVDDAKAKQGIWVFAEAANGRRLERTGRDADGAKLEFLRQEILGKTFAQLPAKLEFPEFHVERVTQTYASPPASYLVVAPLSHREQALVLTGKSSAKPLFHDLEHPTARVCQTAELSRLSVLAHRSVAMVGLGDPHLTVIAPDCVNFASAEFKLAHLKIWNKAGQSLGIKGSGNEGKHPVEISESGYRPSVSGYTWYLEGDQGATIGKVEGEVEIEVADLQAVTVDQKSIGRDASSLGKIRAPLPDGTELEGDPVLLDAAGLPLALSSSNRSSDGSQVTLECDCDLSRVTQLVFLARKGDKQHVSVRFAVDFSKIPLPPKKN
jgi:hypothetical protein